MAQNEQLSRAELVAKLENISGLYRKTRQIQEEMDDFQPEDNYEREVIVPEFPGEFRSEEERRVWRDQLDHEDDGAIEVARNVHRKTYAPEQPKKPRMEAFKEEKDKALETQRSKFANRSGVSLGVGIFFLLGALVGVDESTSDTLPVILIIAAIGVAGFVYFKYKQKALQKAIDAKIAAARNAHESRQAEIMTQYEENKKAYESAKAEYEKKLEVFMEEYVQWREVFLESCREEEEIEARLEEDRQAAVDKIYNEKMCPAQAALEQANDLVTEEYLPVLSVLIDLIKSSRADGLKEAINLYEDLVYRERQLQLQREQEEQRRYEEEQRREAEERRHREEMKFREDQERQRRYEEDQRRKDEERRHQEDMRAREAEARHRELQEREQRRREEYKAHMNQVEQRNKQRSAAQAQCRACAHVGRCNMTIHNDTPTCTGFTPR